MVVRDPWRRAVSAFHEDNGYQSWINLTEQGQKRDVAARRAAMMTYLQHPENFNHGLPASSFCSLEQGLRFDHYVDIDRGMAELGSVLLQTSPPVPSELLTTGWEQCTKGGEESILNARLRTSHTWHESKQELDDVYCTPELVRQAVIHFREDYLLVAPLAGFPVLPPCLSQEEVVDIISTL
jgi:hypothetical protein